MEITVRQDSTMRHFDTGGGVREVCMTITVDDKLEFRLKRQVVIYEVLGGLLGYAVTHELLENIAEKINDALDQLGEDDE